MSHWVSAADLLTTTRADDALVAWDGNQVFSWKMFRTDVARVTNALAAQGGTRSAVYTDSAYWFAVALFATWQAGLPLILLPNRQPLTLASLQEGDILLRDWAQPAVLQRSLVLPDCGESAVVPSFGVLEPSRCRIDIFTSGSTGEAKCIVKTLSHFAAEVAVLEELWGASVGNARVLASVSHQHVYGVLFRVLWPLCAGRPFAARVVEYPEQIFKQQGPLVLVSSPALLKRIVEEPMRGHLGLVFSSGGPLEETVNLRIGECWNVPLIEVFGSTETGGVAVRNRREGDAWTLMPGVEALVDDGGLLRVSSPHVAPGYEQMSDRAELLSGRQLRLLGRADRIVKLEEKRVSLVAVENRLQDLAWVSDVHALVLGGSRERLAVVIELNQQGASLLNRDGAAALKQEVRNWLAIEMESVTLPRRIRFVKALPLTSQGKLDRHAIERLFVDVNETTKLPEVLQADLHSDKASLRVKVPMDCCWFKGHFDQAPILSGVAQLDWIMTLAAEYLQIQAPFMGVEALKFQQVIQPGDELLVELEYKADKHRLYFSFGNERQVSSGRIILESGSPL